MKFKLIHDHQGEKTFALIFETGDEAMSALVEFAKANHLGASHFTGIGAFRDVTLGYFDWETKEYRRIPLSQQVEVLSLIGDVARRTVNRRCMLMWSSGDSMAQPVADISSKPMCDRPWNSSSPNRPPICGRKSTRNPGWP